MLIIIECAFSSLRAQDAVFSHYYANALYLNPAMTGIEGPGKLYIGYRNHWPGVPDSYVTYHASYEQYFELLQGGLGLHLMNDRQASGVYNTISIDGMYAYHLRVTRALYLSGGLQASFGHRTLNWDGLVTPDMIEPGTGNILQPTEISGDYSTSYPDFSIGLAAFYNHYFGGIAVHHLHTPHVSVTGRAYGDTTRLSRKYTLHMGAMIPVYEKRLGKEVCQLLPHLIVIQQKSYQQLIYGLEIVYRNIVGGVWGRQDLTFSYGTIIFTVGYGTGPFRFRYSYDSRISRPDIYISNLGAHELSLMIIFENLDKSKKHRAIKCPKI